MTGKECLQCKGIWLDNHKIEEFQKNAYSKSNQDSHYYYKKDFIENGSLDDLFGFEYEQFIVKFDK